MTLYTTIRQRLLAAAIAALFLAWPLTTISIAQTYTWKNVAIGGGGFVTGVVYSPKQADLIYARTDTGGAFRWDASAQRWLALMDWVGQGQSNLLGIESIAVDPDDPKRVYLAAGANTQAWAGNGLILRSSDQGRTWKKIEMPLKMGGGEDGRTIGERLAIDPSQTNVLYFGSRNDGLWRSADSGDTWDRVGAFPLVSRTNGIGIGFIVFDPRTGTGGALTQTIYVGVAVPGDTLYRSTNGGITWMPLMGQPTKLLPHRAVVDERGVLYVTYTNNPGPSGITDGAVWQYDPTGEKWTNITPMAPSPENGRFGYSGITCDVRNPGTLMVSTIGRGKDGEDLFRSTDGGKNWRSASQLALINIDSAPYLTFGRPSANLGKWISDVRIDPFNSDRVIYGTSSTIWATESISNLDSDQSLTWAPRAAGLELATVNVLASPPTGALLISGLSDIGGFRHDDLDVSPKQGMFTNPVFTSTDSIDFAQQKPEIVVRVGSGQPGKRGAFSSDGGKTWKPFATEPRGSGGSGTISISADGRTLIWCARNCQPHFSGDFGTTWTPCRGISVKAMAITDRETPSAAYACDGAKMYFSDDGGATFARREDVTLPIGHGQLYATPGKAGHLWLIASKIGLHRSVDGGVKFDRTKFVQDVQAFGFGAPAPGKDYPALYLVGTVNDVSGVFRSNDAGGQWVKINDDAHQYGLLGRAITGDPRTYGRVYLGTVGRGILVGQPSGQ